MLKKVAFENNPVLEQSVEHSLEDRIVPGSNPCSETLEDRIVLGLNHFILSRGTVTMDST